MTYLKFKMDRTEFFLNCKRLRGIHCIPSSSECCIARLPSKNGPIRKGKFSQGSVETVIPWLETTGLLHSPRFVEWNTATTQMSHPSIVFNGSMLRWNAIKRIFFFYFFYGAIIHDVTFKDIVIAYIKTRVHSHLIYTHKKKIKS